MDAKQPKKQQEEGGKLEGLPIKDSPYTRYKDLEDYKQQGYGTQGHQKVEIGRGAGGSTDAPTSVVGGAVAADSQANKGGAGDPTKAATATDIVNEFGVC